MSPAHKTAPRDPPTLSNMPHQFWGWKKCNESNDFNNGVQTIRIVKCHSFKGDKTTPRKFFYTRWNNTANKCLES